MNWTPFDLHKITIDNCIYIGELEIYTQDNCSGEISHGGKKRLSQVYGMKNIEENCINFIASFNVSDKFESLEINGEYPVAGLIKKQGRYKHSNYKIGFSCTLISLESQSTKKLIEENKDISYFEGIGRLSYVPWSEKEEIKIRYYLFKKKLAYITFNLSKEQYNNWLDFKELNMTKYDYGNDKYY